MGEPEDLITLETVTITRGNNTDTTNTDDPDEQIPAEDILTVNSVTQVGTLNTTAVIASNEPTGYTHEAGTVTITLSLEEDQVDQINSGNSYIHYVGPAVSVAGLNDADNVGPFDIAASTAGEPSVTAVNITDSDTDSGEMITLTFSGVTDC